jgi:hypothetical protein
LWPFFAGFEEKLPNLPNLPKYIHGLSGNVSILRGHEKDDVSGTG